MFNFKTTLYQLNRDYLYFFIPSNISQVLKKGDCLNIKFKGFSSLNKKLAKPRKYPYKQGNKKLFMVILPRDFVKKNKLKAGKEVHIKCQKN
jgi:hypothetical protein